jgi:porin
MKKGLGQSTSFLLLGMAVLGFCIVANSYAQETADYASTKLTGNWWGERTKLAEQGITFDIDVVQSVQKVTGGGKDNEMRYGGSVDYRFKFDFQKMGLWEGAFLDVQLEHQFGQFANEDVGAILGTNTDGVFPLPNYREINISEFKYTQFLSESIAVFLGKINTLDGDDNVFSGGRGKTNFMHQNFVLNPVGIRTVPYSTLGAGGAVFFPNALAKDPAILSFMVLGADGQPNTSGFSKDFDDGQTYCLAYRQPTRFFDQSGSHTFSGTYGTKNYTMLGQDPRLILGELLGYGWAPAKEDNSWSLMYNMHQYLYTEKEDSSQGFGIFSRLGTADDKTNPIANFYSAGLGGKGTIHGRDNDTWGIGYFYAQLSDEFGGIIKRNFDDTQGVEMFYNVELSKWLHITPDFQIIEPSNQRTDTAYVAAIRAKIDF